MLDGELCCLDAQGRPDFYALMFRRAQPYFYAFDLLSLNGRDLRAQPLHERKRLLAEVLPPNDDRLLRLDHVRERGCEFFDALCEQDLEGVVAKWIHGTYQNGDGTSWLKIKNPDYSQGEDRGDLFDHSPHKARRAAKPPKLRLV